MSFLRTTRHLRLVGRCVLLWLALSMGVAIASPIVHPQSLELVCASAGVVKLMVQTDDGAQELGLELGAGHLDCPLCLLSGPPLPSRAADLPMLPPQGLALQPIEAARWVATTAAPPPARGPPSLA